MGEHVDKFGFYTPGTPNPSVSSLLVNSRIEKWHLMLARWEKYVTSKKNVLKRRCRKGIPHVLRGRVWFLLAKCQELKDRYPENFYSQITARETDPPCMLDIRKDIDRTFPQHVYFRFQGGQQVLLNLLRSYALFDPDIGYCQGMGYLAGVLLMQMDEENAFFMLINLMENYQVRGYFVQGMSRVYQSLYKMVSLLKFFEPSLWTHFSDIEFSPQIYATQWFMTLYTCSFPIETVLRIWDCLLFEGPKIIFRVSLGFFKIHKNQLKNLDFDKLLRTVRELEKEVDADTLIKAAFSINLSRKKLLELDREYVTSPRAELISWR